jgi:hypothetical protein
LLRAEEGMRRSLESMPDDSEPALVMKAEEEWKRRRIEQPVE